jgi:hypothetical protein
MTLKYAERVKETTTNKPATNATPFDLGGARTGFRGFAAAMGTGSKCVACAQKVDANGNPAGAWEVFVGTVTDAATDSLSRDHRIASSSGAFIDWSATGENSSPDVFVVHPSGVGETGFGPTLFVAPDLWHAPLSAPATYGPANIEVAVLASPVVIPYPAVIEGLRARQTGGSAAGRFVRLGVYRQNGPASEPMELVVDGGEIDCSSASPAIRSVTSIGKFVQPGTYWTALLGSTNLMSFDGTGSSFGSSTVTNYVMGVSSGTTMTDGAICGLRRNVAYGPFPTSVTFNDFRGANHPVVQVKFSHP